MCLLLLTSMLQNRYMGIPTLLASLDIFNTMLLFFWKKNNLEKYLDFIPEPYFKILKSSAIYTKKISRD